MSADALLREIVGRLTAVVPEGSKIVLFGSRARGDHRAVSDIDMLVIELKVDDPILESVRLRSALHGLGVPIDVVVLSRDEAAHPAAVPGPIGGCRSISVDADLGGDACRRAGPGRWPISRPSSACTSRCRSIPVAWAFCPATISKAPATWAFRWWHRPVLRSGLFQASVSTSTAGSTKTTSTSTTDAAAWIRPIGADGQQVMVAVDTRTGRDHRQGCGSCPSAGTLCCCSIPTSKRTGPRIAN